MEYVAGSIALGKNIAANEVGDYLNVLLSSYEGQIGYKQPSVGVPDKDDVPSFVVISRGHGILLIDVVDDKVCGFDDSLNYFRVQDRFIPSRDHVCDNFEQEVNNRLMKTSLYNRVTRQLAIPTNKILLFFRNTDEDLKDIGAEHNLISKFLSNVHWMEKLEYILSVLCVADIPIADLDLCVSSLEGTAAYKKSSKNFTPVDLETKNDFIKASLDTTFKLDQTQRRVAMQIPDGPQRIRGLAGTGKTVILSLKAALAHKDFPEFKILFLFNTQSMYSQIYSRIEQYFISETRRKPNWNNLHVFHAWGGKSQRGLYYDICRKHGLRPATYSDVMGKKDALGAIYVQLLSNCGALIEPVYDLILIDEAQDFSPAIFETAFLLCKGPNRIVWAYDEFQSMTDIRMPLPEDLFGKNADGQPNLPNSSLVGTYPGGIEKDFILPNSYRTPGVTLVTAHSLALGLHRSAGAIDMIESKRDWEALGYEVLQPDKQQLESGDAVIIKRPLHHNRNILENLLQENECATDLISYDAYRNIDEQISAVVAAISALVQDEHLDAEEILVITLNLKKAKEHFSTLRARLNSFSIQSIMPGFIEDPSAFKLKRCVTLATPFRAKGNEANVVFVIGAELVPGDATFRLRNALFVAMTRSRGWTHISGIGSRAEELRTEIATAQTDYPKLRFTYPAPEELSRRRRILERNDADLRDQQEALDRITAENPEFLIEFLKSNPDIIKRATGGE